jgi:hypothetical protein
MCAGSPTFLALLERAKRVVQGAIEHADVPFARVVEAARVPRSTAYTPVYQTMMTLQGASYGTRKVDAAMSLAGLEVEDWAVRCHTCPLLAVAAWSLCGAAVASELAFMTASSGRPRK